MNSVPALFFCSNQRAGLAPFRVESAMANSVRVESAMANSVEFARIVVSGSEGVTPVAVAGAVNEETDENKLRRLRVAPCLWDVAWRGRHLSVEFENDLAEKGIHIGGDGSVVSVGQDVFLIGYQDWGRIVRISELGLNPRLWLGRNAGYLKFGEMYCEDIRHMIRADRGPAAFAVRSLQRAFRTKLRARIAREWERMVEDALAIAACYLKSRGGFVRKSRRGVKPWPVALR